MRDNVINQLCWLDPAHSLTAKAERAIIYERLGRNVPFSRIPTLPRRPAPAIDLTPTLLPYLLRRHTSSPMNRGQRRHSVAPHWGDILTWRRVGMGQQQIIRHITSRSTEPELHVSLPLDPCLPTIHNLWRERCTDDVVGIDRRSPCISTSPMR